MAFFSIVIPTYNRAHLIQETLRSVSRQLFKDYEILVIDDGSTDNTEQKVRELNLANLNYYKIQNSERGYARNFGYAKSVGEFVVFLDSDDLLKPTHLTELKKAIDSHPSIFFFATKYEFLLSTGGTKFSDMNLLPPGLYNYRHFLVGNFLACNICVKNKSIHLYPFVEDRSYSIMEDWMYLLQNLFASPIYIIDSTTVQMRDHQERSMRTSNQIIDKRIRATYWVESILLLSNSETKKLWAYTFYFCAIHSYIEGETKKAFNYLMQAIARKGFVIKFLLLAVKIVLLPRRKT